MLTIRVVTADDLPVLLPLLRAYCDFYEVQPSDEGLIALAQALIDNPAEGEQLLAFDASGTVRGFATVFWSWQTLYAARVGVLNDLYVVPDARGEGVGRALIDECRQHCARRGAAKLVWETALDNHTAQRLYDGIGAERSTWFTYEIDATDS